MHKIKPAAVRTGKVTARIMNHAGALTNPRYRRYWQQPRQVTHEMLKPGDIFLSRSPVSIKSATGSFLRGGPFTHSFIYIGEGRCVDTREGGVKINALNVLLGAYPSSFVFRADLTDAQRNQIVNGAIGHVGKSKFNAKVARSVLRREAIGIPLKKEFDGVICSSIVARIYGGAGVELIPKKHPDTYSPNSFIHSKKLTCING